VVGAALLAAAAIVALTLVQRVQTDPLQVGASQVARLPADSEFEAPAVFSPDRTREMLGYRDFYGVRAVIQGPSDTGSDECMTIYQPELLAVSDGGYSYSGPQLLTACAAGAFPAAVAFTVTEELPEPLRDAYPVGTSLQFVYDRSNDEIVIFQG